MRFRYLWLSVFFWGICLDVAFTAHNDLPSDYSENQHDPLDPEDQEEQRLRNDDDDEEEGGETEGDEIDDYDKIDDDEDGEQEADESQGDEEDDDSQSYLEHDAFLGDNYTEFKGLAAEEAKLKLKKLIEDEVDINKDGFLTEEEIIQRFRVTTKNYRKKEVLETMNQHDEDKDGKLSWEEFKKGYFANDMDEDSREQMKEDEEKFKYADEDEDGKLDLEEYMAFYHPGDNERLAAFTIEDNLKKHDKDKDGGISKKEFLAIFYDINDDAKEEMEKDFKNNFDKDHNGKLDKYEMRNWLFPGDDFVTEEAETLIKEADDSKDGKLSMNEIMRNYKVFIEDQPNDSMHDEL